ncbi:MAG: type II toxin-antitoxin system Phd/YefM family antitoxin [Sporomusaceae bacterium]|jgi:PHD/YefM family antitoxin component YafN of YafNO toxin-antitoxin module|nr:type II toxin-antitoxin system Phd/YefM family antitoxin [Sporomusaceae bacterium]
MPNIKSSTDLRNNYNAISAFCHKNREPVFITKNGQGDLAVMSIELYEEIIKRRNSSIEESREELYRLLTEGRADVEAGRTYPAAEVFAKVRKDITDGTI